MDMKDWDQAITEVVQSLNAPFDTHRVILDLAHRNQRRYIEALATWEGEPPFQQLHAAFGRRIKVVCESLGLIGEETRSPDIFGHSDQCQKWSIRQTG